jgi:hypothetical protein
MKLSEVEDLIILGKRDRLLKIRALNHALANGNKTRIHFFDETKDERVNKLLGYIAPDKTLIQVIVDREDTPLTIAHYLQVSSWARESRRNNLIFTTDDSEGIPEIC